MKVCEERKEVCMCVGIPSHPKGCASHRCRALISLRIGIGAIQPIRIGACNRTGIGAIQLILVQNTRGNVIGCWTENRVVMPTVLPTVGRRGPRPWLFAGALRPTVGNSAGRTTPCALHFPTTLAFCPRCGRTPRPPPPPPPLSPPLSLSLSLHPSLYLFP